MMAAKQPVREIAEGAADHEARATARRVEPARHAKAASTATRTTTSRPSQTAWPVKRLKAEPVL